MTSSIDYSPEQITLGNSRLLKLTTFLRKVPHKHWYFYALVCSRTRDNEDLIGQMREIGEKLIEVDCESKACALGWMPIVFPDEIVCWVSRIYIGYKFLTLATIGDEGTFIESKLWHFFALNYNDFENIFYGRKQYDSDYVTPEMVAARIENLVRLRSS